MHKFIVFHLHLPDSSSHPWGTKPFGEPVALKQIAFASWRGNLIEGNLSVYLCVICGPQVSTGCTWSTSTPSEWNCLNLEPLLTSTHLFLFFFPTRAIAFHTLFNLLIPSRSSRQLFTTISSHSTSKTVIFSTPVKPPPHHFPPHVSYVAYVSTLCTLCFLPHPSLLPAHLACSSPYTFSLYVFPLSPAVPFVMFCLDLFCVLALPWALCM